MADPIYLLGSERSGTNFFRKSLGEAQATICCTVPPVHFLRTFGYWSHAMGDLSGDAAWCRAIEYFIRSTQERAVPWDIQPTCGEVRERYLATFGPRRDLVRLTHVFYQIYAESKGYDTYLCKDLWLHDFVREISAALPRARFVHLVRDPRDVCASQKKRPFGQQDVWKLSRDWKSQCDAALRLAMDPGLSPRFLRLSYETLIRSHAEAVAEAVDWLQVERGERPGGDEIPTHFHEWKNLDRPVMTDNSGLYGKVLSGLEVEVIEAVTWPTLQSLGYQPTARQRPRPGFWARRGYPVVATARWKARRTLNRWRLRNEPINRWASSGLVAELEEKFR